MKEPDNRNASPGGTRGAKLPPVLIQLLKGVLYRDQHPLLWDDLRTLEGQVLDYFKKVGLELALDDAYGFAYLRQDSGEDEDMPRLIPRRPLTVQLSLLCVILRKMMIEAESSGAGRPVLTHAKIVETMKLYWPQRADETKVDDKISQQIGKAVDFDLLKKLESEPVAYEIMPIIKALVDAGWVGALDDKLKSYQDAISRD